MKQQLYRIGIGCVDGESSFECTGDKETVRNFLIQHDHEGSVVQLFKLIEIKESEIPKEIGIDLDT